ncbi:hypothetical protein HTSR_1548 [Halodesulfurarchaeum formicicum]|uniref:Uncharacterized protein n=1 Tax=Halodesulfurarchaeum formicicum TaxID=1873524 RepID=A0A1D8S5U3_9EURY|nr:hypothetical protein [Halodesulfurarchaeum formicicum]AOW80721.1 hypothetical protein HTSR_1548 [Halodesulfurarchaeum formicicum]
MGDDGLSSDVKNRLSERREANQGASGTLILSDEEAYVHDTITIRGLNLPPDAELDVFWRTVEGKWGVLQGNEVNGAQYRPRTIHALTAQTDDQGKFSEEWTVPKDYGGEHTIEVRNGDDEAIATAAVRIRPHFEIEETEAPLGGFFTVTGYGIGPNVVENNYQLTWDNGMVGFITGVKNHGTATARIRAAGPVGSHQIQVWRNYRGVPFMQNNTQSPFGEVAAGRQYQFDVEVTEPDSELGGYWVEELFDESPLQVHVPDPEVEHDATIDITPQSGQSGTDAVITGTDFPANTDVELVWHSHSGHRVKDIPIRPEPLPEVLPTVTTDEDGRFQEEITIPQDKGSTRPIAAKIDDRSVATTGFMMQADILEVSPQTAEQGETIEIELGGIGWPTYENAYYFVYDNKPIGYVCGLEARTAKTEITASGQPGYHFIDVYPSFFDVKDDEPNFELTPHLSYLDNHPIRPLPGLHMTIEITE